MFYYIKCFTIGFAVFLLAACKNTTQPPDSNSGGQTTSTITPDTVDYTPVAGEWEGAGAYKSPELYESDSLYITHFKLGKKAVSEDSIGVASWNNKNEYIYGRIMKALPEEGENTYKVKVVYGNNTIITFTHHKEKGEEWLEWSGYQVSDGKMYRK